MLIIILIILFILFNKYFASFNLNIFKKIISKYCSQNTQEWLDKILSKGFVLSERLVLILLVINCILPLREN